MSEYDSILHDSSSQVQFRELDILGYVDYKVGTDGSFWSKKRKVWHKLIPWKTKGGYAQVSPCVNGKSEKFYIHTLVLLAFVGPCPPGMECRHRDNNPSNNCLSNLSWDTPKQNGIDRSKNGKLKGMNHPGSKLSDIDIHEIRIAHKNKETMKSISICYRVTRHAIGLIVNGKLWSHIPILQ